MSASWLKRIALISMVLDHMYKTFFTQDMLHNVFGIPFRVSYDWMHVLLFLGRIAFPIFAFFIAEGCVHTRDRKKYLLRLLIFGAVSEIPFQLALSEQLTFMPKNVIFTFFLGALACFSIDYFRKKERAWIAVFPVVFLGFLAEICKMDYGAFGIAFVVSSYIFTSKATRIAVFSSLLTIQYLLYYSYADGALSWLQGDLYFVILWGGALCAVLLIHCYNGTRGKGSKWTFYCFYPMHLLLFYTLQRSL